MAIKITIICGIILATIIILIILGISIYVNIEYNKVGKMLDEQYFIIGYEDGWIKNDKTSELEYSKYRRLIKQ